VATLKGSNQY